MESSRRWWIRPVVAAVLGLLAVIFVLGSARGRESPGPQPTLASASAPSPRTPVAEPVPDDVEVKEAELSTKIEAPVRAERPTRPPNPKPKPKPSRLAKSRPSPRPPSARACPPAPAAPSLKLGLVANLDDRRIDESSGLAASRRHADLAYTMNDEGSSPLIFGIQVSTGRTRSAFDLRGAGRFRDPESIRMDPRGRLWLADTGDGHPGKPGKKHDRPHREHVTIAVFDEPGPRRHAPVKARRYSVEYSDGPHNVEALAIHPATGQAFLISNAPRGKVYALPNPLHGGRNVARATEHRMPPFVTDATFAADGRYVLVRTMRDRDVLIFDSTTWTRVGRIKAPAMEKGESITVERDRRSVLLGSEGRRSPVIRVGLPAFVEAPRLPKSRC